MAKEEILDKFWVNYLRYWQKEVRDMANPPTEDGFWAWYAFRILEQEHYPDTDPDVKKQSKES